MRGPKRVVYRALIGGYERLHEEVMAHESDIPFICFTDDPTLTSDTWRIVLHEPRSPRDLTRSARALKILGHPALDDYDETVWVDNTVALKQPPDELFDTWLADADVAAPLHSFRRSVLSEAEAIIDGGLDDFARVYEQMTHYLATNAAVLEENPHWTGMLARRRTEASASAMQIWWEDVLRYSRRDQLSFNWAMRSAGVKVRSVPLENLKSAWHAWPVAAGRAPGRQGSGLREALRPPAGRIGELQQSVDEAGRELAVAVAHREDVVVELETALAEARERAEAAEGARCHAALEGHELQSRLADAEAENWRLRDVVARKSEKLQKTRHRLPRLRRLRREAALMAAGTQEFRRGPR